jgi:hypothetical protein
VAELVVNIVEGVDDQSGDVFVEHRVLEILDRGRSTALGNHGWPRKATEKDNRNRTTEIGQQNRATEIGQQKNDFRKATEEGGREGWCKSDRPPSDGSGALAVDITVVVAVSISSQFSVAFRGLPWLKKILSMPPDPSIILPPHRTSVSTGYMCARPGEPLDGETWTTKTRGHVACRGHDPELGSSVVPEGGRRSA